MYHKCVKCGTMYERASEEILVGCSCGSKLFYFVKPQSAGKKKDPEESECFYESDDDEGREMMIFDIETINVISNGKYELNIDSLMNGRDNDGLIYKYGDGKYGIDINVGMAHPSKNLISKNLINKKKR